MLLVAKKTIQALKMGDMSIGQYADELVANYPAREIALAYAELLAMSEEQQKIVITQEEFNAHFRLRGFTADGEPQNRGRKKKEEIVRSL